MVLGYVSKEKCLKNNTRCSAKQKACLPSRSQGNCSGARGQSCDSEVKKIRMKAGVPRSAVVLAASCNVLGPCEQHPTNEKQTQSNREAESHLG